MSEAGWDRIVDVVVVGSGAAALTAAITAADAGCAVEVLEKTDKVGGTSAFSGGMPWVPMNDHMGEAEVDDSREEALEYLEVVTKGRAPDPALLEHYVDNAAAAFRYIESATPLRFTPSRAFSDYYADKPGGKPRARSLDTAPYDVIGELGEWAGRVRETPHMPMGLTQDELASAGSAPDPRNTYVGDGTDAPVDLMALMEERANAGLRTLGVGMVGALLRGALDHDVVISLGTPARELVREGEDVVGVVAEHDGAAVRIGARRGVVLAAGGFEWDEELVRAFLGVPQVNPLSPPHNVGDALRMGLSVGAMVANMSVAWAYPVAYDGVSTYEGKPLSILATPRQEPGCITVNQSGKRFVNEGVTYMDMPRTHRTYDPTTQSYPNESPVWMVFDQRVRDRLHMADVHPGDPTPDWVKEAPTIGELAKLIDVPPANLEAELARYNENAAKGEDPDFGRGTVWWEGWTTGGPSPEKSLATIEEAPFYAMPLYDGILGTAGGLLVDPDARVRAMAGGVIPGLYAAGNTAASIFGPGYPGGGSTLGPAMTFGYLAGRDLGRRDARRLAEEPAVAGS